MKIYTKTGDKGQTSLIGGSRISKDDLRVECYGTIDEATSALGVAYAAITDEDMRKNIQALQGRMFILGAQLASDEKGLQLLKTKINEEDVASIEEMIDDYTSRNDLQKAFVTPGANMASAQLHVARAIIRRAERRMIALGCDEILVVYVNRLSDVVFMMAVETAQNPQ